MLNIHILYDELFSCNPKIRAEAHLPLTLIGSRILSLETSEQSEHYLYIVNDDTSTLLQEDKCEINIIYVGDNAESFMLAHPHCQLLMIRGDLSPQTILNVVQDVFETYSLWKQRTLMLIARNVSLQTIFDECATHLKNPVSLFDNTLATIMIAGHLPVNIENTVWDGVAHNGYFDMSEDTAEEVDFINSNVLHNGYPFLYSSKFRAPQIHMVAGLFIDKKLVASLGSTNITAPFTEGQLAVICIVRELMETALCRNNQYLALTDGVDYYLDRLLQGQQIDDGAVSYYLSQHGWHLNDSYGLLFFIRRDKVSLGSLEKEQYTSILKRFITNGYTVPYENGIIVIVHDFMTFTQHDGIMQGLESMLKKLNLICGISMEFNNYLSIKYAFIQSKTSLEREFIKKKQLIYPYIEHYATHLVRCIEKTTSSKSMCYPKLLRLFENDRDTALETIAILNTYLTKGKNISAAANVLHMHRNTLLYRLAKISQILQIDLEELDGEMTLVLLISCTILLELS